MAKTAMDRAPVAASRAPLCAGGGLAVAVALLAGSARADDSHYQDFVVGGRAMGLGGAFTSIADDPSGVYYNPAGIADIRESNYQVSTSLYGFERGGYGTALILPVTGLESLDVQFTDLVIVPASAGFVQSFGAKGEDGLPVQSFALSVIVPSFRTFSARNPQGEETSEATDLVGPSERFYTRRVTDRSLWSGVGYGRKLGHYLRLGASAYYILRSVQDVEELTQSATVRDRNDDPDDDQQIFGSARNDIELVNGALVFIVGAKLILPWDLRVGLSFQTPSLQLHSGATLRITSTDAVPSCDTLDLDPDDLEACRADPHLSDPHSAFRTQTISGSSETQYPATFRLGASWEKKYRFIVSSDVTIHLPTSYDLVKSAALDADLLGRIPFNPHVERKPVVNVNLGAEVLIVREVSVAAGVFTDFSSAATIPRAPTADAQPNVNMRGLTMALGYFSKHSLSRIGILYSWGEGYDVIPTSDTGRLLTQQQSFKRVSYFQSFFYVFLSSTFRY